MEQAATYLDHNATTPVKPAVAAAMTEALAIGGNPSSVHRFGRLARAAVDRARDQVAAMVGAEPRQVVFTSGGTEANALGLGAALANRPGRLAIFATEHASVRAQATLTGDGVELAVDADGIADLDALERVLAAGGIGAVSLMLVNNETGVVQPVATAAALAHRFGALIHCDAAQAPARMPVDVRALGVDFLTLSAHKIGGPQGTGALIAGEGLRVPAMAPGGGQERGMRAGTENVSGIAGFGAAADLTTDDLARAPALAALRDGLERDLHRLSHDLSAEIRVFGAATDRVPNTTCFALEGLSNETQVIALDLAGVAVSAGSACSSGKVSPSHVLRAMGADEGLAASAIRVSLGWNTSQSDVERFLGAWSELAQRHRASTSARALADLARAV